MSNLSSLKKGTKHAEGLRACVWECGPMDFSLVCAVLVCAADLVVFMCDFRAVRFVVESPPRVQNER